MSWACVALAAPPVRGDATGPAPVQALLGAWRLPPERAAVEGERAAVARFYAGRGWALAWVGDGASPARTRALVAALAGAAAHGLDPRDYGGARWPDRLANVDRDATEVERARVDVALTFDALRFASDLARGRIGAARERWSLDRGDRRERPGAVLERLATADDVEGVFRGIEPPWPAYRRTLRALARYRELAASGEGAPLPRVRDAVRPGAAWAGTAPLAGRLRALGDLSPDDSLATGDRYEGPLVEAVKRFQRRHGLEADGILGRETLQALGVPLARRVEQLELTLERWRWIPRAFGPPFVLVNIPEFRLYATDGKERRLSTRVVVGRRYRTRTPVFAAAMTEVVFRPPWNVPASIQRDELAPRVAADPGLLSRERYDLVDRSGRPVDPPRATPDLVTALRSGAVRLRERPGPGNALGTVKFVLPNPYGVYLHATPSRRLFARTRRDFSHGCIRVEDPAALAAWALRDVPGWDPDHVRAAMEGARTLHVALPEPIPVLIVYGTAVAGEGDEVRFFDDVYGQDAALRRALRERRGPAGVHQ